MPSNTILRRLEAIEEELASHHRPKLVLCWTQKLAERIGHALGPGYIFVTLPCQDEDEFEAEIRENPAISERLDKLLAGIPPE